jgi:hypothetical protein
MFSYELHRDARRSRRDARDGYLDVPRYGRPKGSYIMRPTSGDVNSPLRLFERPPSRHLLEGERQRALPNCSSFQGGEEHAGCTQSGAGD